MVQRRQVSPHRQDLVTPAPEWRYALQSVLRWLLPGHVT